MEAIIWRVLLIVACIGMTACSKSAPSAHGTGVTPTTPYSPIGDTGGSAIGPDIAPGDFSVIEPVFGDAFPNGQWREVAFYDVGLGQYLNPTYVHSLMVVDTIGVTMYTPSFDLKCIRKDSASRDYDPVTAAPIFTNVIKSGDGNDGRGKMEVYGDFDRGLVGYTTTMESMGLNSHIRKFVYMGPVTSETMTDIERITVDSNRFGDLTVCPIGYQDDYDSIDFDAIYDTATYDYDQVLSNMARPRYTIPEIKAISDHLLGGGTMTDGLIQPARAE